MSSTLSGVPAVSATSDVEANEMLDVFLPINLRRNKVSGTRLIGITLVKLARIRPGVLATILMGAICEENPLAPKKRKF